MFFIDIKNGVCFVETITLAKSREEDSRAANLISFEVHFTLRLSHSAMIQPLILHCRSNKGYILWQAPLVG